MDKKARFARRLDEIRQMLAAHRLDGVRLTLQKNVAWLIGGRAHVNTASEAACCQFVISRDECLFISNNIEQRRLLEEEIGFADGGHITRFEQWNWYEPEKLDAIVARHAAGKERVAADTEVEEALLRLRSRIDRDDLANLRQFGLLAADAINRAAFEVERGDTEYGIAAKLACRCLERGLEPIVNLIAADERIYARRHPLPTARRVDRYAMLVVCARIQGFVLSATRLVHFGPPSDRLQALHRAVAEIDARVIDATRPGVKLAELFEKLKQFYREAGHEAEFANHHQGGLTGYNSRERLAVRAASSAVEAGQMYAWNPSLSGVKSEDTLIVGEDRNELLTKCGNFPMIEVKVGGRKWERPDILIRQLI